jgi:hypothetical protein
MSIDEPKRNRKRFTWFKFFPSDWIEILTMTDCQAGKRFKVMIKRLISNSSQEGSIESIMINESIDFAEIRRKAALKRWRERGQVENAKSLPKTKQEVIDFAVDNGIDVDDAVEWAQINLKERKGKDKDGNPIMNWEAACKAYCASVAKKRKRRNG